MAKFDRKLARYRVIRVSCVEPGYPRIYLEDILRTLKQRVPHVAIGLNWAEPDIASVLKLQPAAIGFSLPPGRAGTAWTEDGSVRAHSRRRRPGASVTM